MATNMPPHNLIEVVAAARHLIAHPEADLEALMRFVPGPDLPTGGKIIGLDGIREAYETGRGTFRTRAATHVENLTPRKKAIVVDELPFGVDPERVVAKISELVRGKKLAGIADVADHTDKDNPLRLVIEIKSGFVPEAVLEHLYKLTPMEDSFGINNVALVDGQPLTLGLKELLQVYLDHRFTVVRRRSAYRRGKAADRLHLVDGLLVALLNIDEVIQVIRTSDDAATAKTRLMEIFELTEIQATYILDTPLRRLTRLDKLELEREAENLRETIAGLDALLESDDLLRTTVSDELGEMSKKFATPRRTVLLESAGTPATTVALEVTDDPCWVLLSATGLLARTPTDEPLPADGPRAKHDVILSAVKASARGHVGAVTSAGRMIRLPVLDMPAVPITAAPPALSGGGALTEFVRLEKGEKVVALASLDPDGPVLAIGTAGGVVKRLKYDVPSNKDEWEVIALKDGDAVVGAASVGSEDDDLVFITTDAQLLKFPAIKVTAQGRTSAGMAGINLSAGAKALWFGVVDPNRDGLVVTIAGSTGTLDVGDGSAKVTPYAEYPGKGRGTGGVRCQRFIKGEDTLTLAWAGAAPVRASSANGAPAELPEVDPRRDGSGTRLTKPVTAVGGPVG
jgi:DNA gyrase subunit A